MPRHDWFEHIELSGSNERRRNDVLRKCKMRGVGRYEIRKAPEASTYYKIKKHRHKPLNFGNHKTWTYRLSDLASIYGLHVNTILGWYRNGMLPKPFYKDSSKYRSWNWAERPVYIKEQILVITKVLDDIFLQSSQFRACYTNHIEMMREGDLMVRERMSYKAVAVKIVKPVKPNYANDPHHIYVRYYVQYKLTLKKYV